MEKADSDLVGGLLARRRLLAVSVLVDGQPYVAQLPFAARSDLGALLVHASRLARHSKGLVDGAPFSALIQAAACFPSYRWRWCKSTPTAPTSKRDIAQRTLTRNH